MQVIPVIDVKGGVAVAAVRGDRASYRPLASPLAASADPVAVARGLRSLYPFTMLYVADLDGIEGRGADTATQAHLIESWPGTELWIDDGSTGSGNFNLGSLPSLALPTSSRRLAFGTTGSEPVQQVAHDRIPPPLWGRLGGGDSDPLLRRQVLGSESFSSMESYARARDHAGPAAPLSLDFRGEAFVGPPELLDDPSLWPEHVIVMTLARVGSGEGPDLARLAALIAKAPKSKFYAAGGVRNGADLRALRDIGAAGALVATALHGGQIKTGDLERIA